MLSICIVSWNTRELLRECLRAIFRYPPEEELEVIVVDNASPDGSTEMVQAEFPQVRLQANAENLLYARASNQALAMVAGDLVLLLNPDTQVKEGCLTRLAAFLRKHEEAGAVAPRLLFPNGKTQSSCRSFPKPRAVLLDMVGMSRLFPGCEVCGEYRMTNFAHDEIREVDQPMASALMLKRAALEEIGGFDEGFPMFFNDVDLCLRLKQAGWKIFFLPEAEVIHQHGAATAQRKREMIAQSHDSLLRFYRKHYRGRVSALGYGAVVALARLGKWVRWQMSGVWGLESAVKGRGSRVEGQEAEPGFRLPTHNSQLTTPNSQPPRKRLTIAIDGPSAAGKTTLAKSLARALGYLHLDTGAMYRAVGWKAQKMGVDLADEAKVTEIARNLEIRLVSADGSNRVFADGEDISAEIRTSQAGEWASRVSAISGVRKALVARQRELGAGGGVVAEGRDMQTVVFPQAEVKIFLTASAKERAKRRLLELQARGIVADLEQIEHDTQKRDERDSNREDSPLRAAADAVLLDSDGKSAEEVLAEALAIVRRAEKAQPSKA